LAPKCPSKDVVMTVTQPCNLPSCQFHLQDVFLDHSTYAAPPARFEAGTPAIGEAIGLGAAVDYLSGLGMDRIHNFEQEIGRYVRLIWIAPFNCMKAMLNPASSCHVVCCCDSIPVCTDACACLCCKPFTNAKAQSNGMAGWQSLLGALQSWP
jgi:hypothetical protein